MCGLRPVYVIALAVLAISAGRPAPAHAEPLVDVYGGGAFPMETDTAVSEPGVTVMGLSEYQESFVAGGRVGYYFDRGAPWLGLALDVSYFQADIDLPDGATHEVVPVALLVLFRAPLIASPAFPYGRLQPYLGAGLNLVYSRAKAGMSSDTSFDLGFDLRVGLTWMLTRKVGLFGEYRYSYVEPEYDFHGTQVEPQFSVNHVVAGVAVRF